MAMLSAKAYEMLADVLNKVEQTGRWPQSTKYAKAAFLEKDPSKAGDPMAYRVLLVLPAVYRRWAGLRLTQM